MFRPVFIYFRNVIELTLLNVYQVLMFLEPPRELSA